jgi:hypothetical protein
MDRASELLAAKTINISKLLALCPPNTIDPTPHLYDNAMYTMSAMAATAFLAHTLVKPYSAKPPLPSQVIEVSETAKSIEDKLTNK